MAGIIKASGQTDAAVFAAPRPFHFDDAGNAYLERVQAQAAQILADARRQAAQIKAKATVEGHEAAIQAVEASLRTRLEQHLTQAIGAVHQAAQRIEQSRQAWQKHWEEHIVQLAAAIGARLCRRELSKNPEITLTWIREALELAAGNTLITLRLNPQDHKSLGDQVTALQKSLAKLGPIEVVADASIAVGGCRVDTQFGSLDQQLETQINRIKEELLS
jgi:flagellar assembly protein FliH